MPSRPCTCTCFLPKHLSRNKKMFSLGWVWWAAGRNTHSCGKDMSEMMAELTGVRLGDLGHGHSMIVAAGKLHMLLVVRLQTCLPWHRRPNRCKSLASTCPARKVVLFRHAVPYWQKSPVMASTCGLLLKDKISGRYHALLDAGCSRIHGIPRA